MISVHSVAQSQNPKWRKVCSLFLPQSFHGSLLLCFLFSVYCQYDVKSETWKKERISFVLSSLFSLLIFCSLFMFTHSFRFCRPSWMKWSAYSRMSCKHTPNNSVAGAQHILFLWGSICSVCCIVNPYFMMIETMNSSGWG